MINIIICFTISLYTHIIKLYVTDVTKQSGVIMNFKTVLLENALFRGVISPEKLFNPLDLEFKLYNSGEAIASTFDDCLHLAIIVDGSVEIQNIYPSGKISSLKKLSSGDLFGESILPGRIHSYPSDIVALESTRVLLIRKSALLDAIKNNNTLLENYIGLLSKKLLMMNEKIKMLSLKTLRKKICWFLLEMYENQNSLFLETPYNQEEIANALGSQRPSVSREINHMEKDGLIEYHRGKITIKNLSEIQAQLR